MTYFYIVYLSKYIEFFIRYSKINLIDKTAEILLDKIFVAFLFSAVLVKRPSS